MSNVQQRYVENLRAAKSPEFVSLINHEIREKMVLLMRIHVSGDFFGKRYTQRWLKIVQKNPRVKFFAYTRSWAIPALLPVLSELGRQPNFEMWFSWDREMPFPPRRKGVRTCYLSMNDDDLPGRKTDLIFRDDQTTVLKRDPHGNLACPFDNGITATTCSRCKLCWKKPGVTSRNLLELTGAA